MGLSLEGWMFFHQLPELADFARAVPDLTIILNHIGGVLRDGPYANRGDEVLNVWRSGIAAVAECPNIHVKLGGIGMPRTGFDWHLRDQPIGSEELAESMAPFMNYCIEHFGPNRSMFESNFPVDKVSYSYNVMYNAFKRLSSGYSATERADMFHDTAAPGIPNSVLVRPDSANRRVTFTRISWSAHCGPRPPASFIAFFSVDTTLAYRASVRCRFRRLTQLLPLRFIRPFVDKGGRSRLPCNRR